MHGIQRLHYVKNFSSVVNVHSGSLVSLSKGSTYIYLLKWQNIFLCFRLFSILLFLFYTCDHINFLFCQTKNSDLAWHVSFGKKIIFAALTWNHITIRDLWPFMLHSIQTRVVSSCLIIHTVALWTAIFLVSVFQRLDSFIPWIITIHCKMQ